jgi:uncharacterized protein Smg (DUF494 family)
MIDMFSLIANEVRNRQELFDEEGKIMQALLNNGYHIHEADAAITLMQTLVQNETDFKPENTRTIGIRAMTGEERRRFSSDAFNFVMKLTHLGIISEERREELIEKAMNTYRGRIDLELMKALIAFSYREHENEDTSFGARKIKNTAWN